MFNQASGVHASEARAILVHLTLTSGETFYGQVNVPKIRTLQQSLNSEDRFLEVIVESGAASLVAKASIAKITPIDMPSSDGMDRQLKIADRLEPHKVLGVVIDADPATIKTAYHAKVKAYHPDRLEGLDLPPEMVDHAAAMLKRITSAYTILSAKAASEQIARGAGRTNTMAPAELNSPSVASRG
ncbi:MAG: DnaJ domain-containing protein [Pseudomonadota bacterium]